ncbi:inter-alpha-trypsin inhibitor heavy chain H3-like, partial [Clarias magur]
CWQGDFRKDVMKGNDVPCCFNQNNSTGLISGDTEDYNCLWPRQDNWEKEARLQWT